jgi:sec-independent protein translocase protein TatC
MTSRKVENQLDFWGHLDELRSVLLRVIAATMVFAVAAFCMKKWLFAVILAPHTSDFVTYRLLGVDTFAIRLVNTGLTEQFMMHMKAACYAGLLLASPYVLFELFRFVSPGLYRNERQAAVWVTGCAYLMFIVGTLLNYFLVFPLTVRFLGTYQVSAEVGNLLTLQSYMDTLLTLTLVMGVVFELPVVTALLAHLGLLTDRLMGRYRRHAVVVILIVAAVITPTTDVFTLLVVAFPVWLLYELSILLCKIVQKHGIKKD